MDLMLNPNKSNAKLPKILLVEDDPHWQILMTSTLQSLHTGALVECVASREEADRALLGKAPYDLVLADVMLTGNGTGVDLWRSHRNDASKTPIILMSGLRQTDFLEMFDQGEKAPGYLPKSAGVQGLREMLADLSEEKPALRPSQWAVLATGLMMMSGTMLIQSGALHTPTFAPRADLPKAANVQRPVMSLIPQSVLGPVPTSDSGSKFITPELKERLARILKNADEARLDVAMKLAGHHVAMHKVR